MLPAAHSGSPSRGVDFVLIGFFQYLFRITGRIVQGDIGRFVQIKIINVIGAGHSFPNPTFYGFRPRAIQYRNSICLPMRIHARKPFMCRHLIRHIFFPLHSALPDYTPNVFFSQPICRRLFSLHRCALDLLEFTNNFLLIKF